MHTTEKTIRKCFNMEMYQNVKGDFLWKVTLKERCISFLYFYIPQKTFKTNQYNFHILKKVVVTSAEVSCYLIQSVSLLHSLWSPLSLNSICLRKISTYKFLHLEILCTHYHPVVCISSLSKHLYRQGALTISSLNSC